MTPDQNSFSIAIARDELLFADGEVHCVGQIIAAVVGVDQVN